MLISNVAEGGGLTTFGISSNGDFSSFNTPSNNPSHFDHDQTPLETLGWLRH